MVRVAVAASANASSVAVTAKVAVINFTIPANPSVVQLPVFRGGLGCVVDIDGTRAVTANSTVIPSLVDSQSIISEIPEFRNSSINVAGGGQVKLINVSNPSTPFISGIANIQLPDIGAISISGSNVSVGEQNGSRIQLLDFSVPSNPRILGTANGVLGGFSSLAFLRNNVIVGSSPNDFRVVIVDFSNPLNPQVNFFNPRLSGSPTLDADSNRIAVGDSGGTNVKLFDGLTLNVLDTRSSNLQSVDSISLSGQFVLAGGTTMTFMLHLSILVSTLQIFLDLKLNLMQVV